MAGIAVRAVVDIIRYALMLRVRVCFGMATGGACKRGVIIGIGMTVRTCGPPARMSTAAVNGEEIVIEHRAAPRTRVMTIRARLWKSRCRMIRIGRAVVLA